MFSMLYTRVFNQYNYVLIPFPRFIGNSFYGELKMASKVKKITKWIVAVPAKIAEWVCWPVSKIHAWLKKFNKK